MRNWDYGSNAYYYVTICTGERKHYFGDIKDGKVILSGIGILADKFRLEIPNHIHNVKLDEHIIMPNHVHGIIIINQYKRICTIESRKINPEFLWQSRFYDHVIRDQKSLENIRAYI